VVIRNIWRNLTAA